MHLINVETRKLESFVGKKIPPYAILSHTWGSDDDELSFHDIQTGNINKAGMTKLEGCCNQAKEDELGYAWIDTCCINKDSSRELDEAINSMFKWYSKASLCYAYLSDVPSEDHFWNPDSKFFSSRWFRRGWTLQELLAPEELHFYDQRWNSMGTKRDMCGEIEKITHIPRQFLLSQNFDGASAAQRMSWAANRETTREEDMAYCLLGIFDVHMPMIYGEGSNAFSRLQEAIMKTGDNSILAWGFDHTESTKRESTDVLSAGILAKTPANFANCGHLVLREQNPPRPLSIASGRVWMDLSLHTTSTGETYGLLNCGPEQNTEQLVGIPLHKVSSAGPSEEYLRPQRRSPALLPRTVSKGVLPKSIHIQIQHQKEAHNAASRRYWFDIGGYKKINLRLIENYPPEEWKKGNALIPETNNSEGNTTRRYLARLHSQNEEARDFIVVLELKIQGLQIIPRCHVMISSRDTSLKDLSEKFVYLRPKALGMQAACDSGLSVKAIIKEERAGRDQMFLVELSRRMNSVWPGVNASFELEQVDLKLEAVRILYEKEEVSKEIIRLGCQVHGNFIQLFLTEGRLAVVGESIRKLEEERKSLTQKLYEARQQGNQLSKKNRVATGKEHELSVREQETQRRLDAQNTAHGPQNWLETTIKTLLDTGEVGRILKKIGDEDPKSSEPPRAGEAEINFRGQTPLCWAIEKKCEAIARLLIQKGADLKAANSDGSTPLHVAASYGEEATARLLIEKGADLEVKDRHGVTPLHGAAYHGQEAITRLLIENGVDLEAKDMFGGTPLRYAHDRGFEAVAALLPWMGRYLQSRKYEVVEKELVSLC